MSGTVERALEIAREGNLRTITDIKRKLASERHEAIEDHLSGAAIKRQLKLLIDQARSTGK